MMLFLDFETYSEVDLKKGGAWMYSKHPSTKVLCAAFSLSKSDNKIDVLTDIHDISNIIMKNVKKCSKIVTWNYFFEFCICKHVLELNVSPHDFHDVMFDALVLSLPASLSKCSSVLRCNQLKDKQGKILIKKLCRPQKNKISDYDVLFEKLKEYCLQDVRVLKDVFKAISLEVNQAAGTSFEKNIRRLDKDINVRGIPINGKFVRNANNIIEQSKPFLADQVKVLTAGKVTNLNSTKQALDYLNNCCGCEITNVQKQTLTQELKNKNLALKAKKFITLRLSNVKSSLAKFKVLKNAAWPEFNAITIAKRNRRITPRLFGALRYHGANTGRWSGQMFQPHNIPRGLTNNKEIRKVVNMIALNDFESCRIIQEHPLEKLVQVLRHSIYSSNGLAVVDYASIEARVLAWLANDVYTLNAFKQKKDIYILEASRIFNIPISSIRKDQRFIGKVATLALGYGGGAKAFKVMSELYGVDIAEEKANQIKHQWRNGHPNIVNFWKNVENAVIYAFSTGRECRVGRIVMSVVLVRGNINLHIQLPSGRKIVYNNARLEDHEVFGQIRSCIMYEGINSKTKQWGITKTYGGRLVENITQAVARDVMADAMLKQSEAPHYQCIVLTVHDEIVFESATPVKFIIRSIIDNPPKWAQELPIELTGYNSNGYKK